MKNWKNAGYTILFGVITAVISCSAIKITKSNIRIQSQDTTNYKSDFKQLPVPALAPVIDIGPEYRSARYQAYKSESRLFKDSLMNGLRSIKDVVDKNGKKIDTGLQQQSAQIEKQSYLLVLVEQLNFKVANLQLDTARLYKNSKVSSEVKSDAAFGNEFKKYALTLLYLILTGILLIMAGIFVLGIIISKKPKYCNG